jgi:hypothetical protein
MIREPERTPKFRKDEKQEQRLFHINALLAPIEEKLIGSFKRPNLPVVFIVGVPRSGSTLLAQLLAQCGGLTYVSNFVARFWMAPYMGMLIEQALGLRQEGLHQQFTSRYGVTEDWMGPHEFGYFWSRWFRFGESHKLDEEALANIDQNNLGRELAALESVYEEPLLFKNLTCGMQIPFLANLLENAIFILCRRNLLYNMQSILMAREKVLGDKRHWFSLRPKEYPYLHSLSPYEQIAGQIYYALHEIETASMPLEPKRFIQVRYELMCSQPRTEVSKIIEAVERLGAKMTWDPLAIPEKFESTNIQHVSNEEFRRIRDAAERIFGGDITC